MALHELATNAIKYGALSNDSGVVTVRWATRPGNRFALEWRETGGPPIVAKPARLGFGSRLLQSGLGVELGSAARLDYRRTGLVCEIDAPALAAEAAGGPSAISPPVSTVGTVAIRPRRKKASTAKPELCP